MGSERLYGGVQDYHWGYVWRGGTLRGPKTELGFPNGVRGPELHWGSQTGFASQLHEGS